MLWQGRVERLGWGGVGIGRAADGRIVLLRSPLALFPGEEVEAEIIWSTRHAEGQVVRWLEPDPRRCTPECRVAERCGGCDLWGAGDATGALKRLMVEDLLARSLRRLQPWAFKWFPAPEWARRQRIQLHWDGAGLGYHARGTNLLVEVDTCPAADTALSAAIPLLRQALAAGELPTAAARWELICDVTRSRTVVYRTDCDNVSEYWELAGSRFVKSTAVLEHVIDGLPFRQHPRVFSQVCLRWAAVAFCDLFNVWGIRGETVYDLYGGGGLLSVLLRQAFTRFVFVENNPLAADDARCNLRTATGLQQAAQQPPAQVFEVCTATVEDWLPEQLGGAADTVVLDPPRAGLSAVVISRLCTSQAGRLILVGCDGATFCRDVQRLASHWKLKQLAVLDLFPNTVQAEFVGCFIQPE